MEIQQNTKISFKEFAERILLSEPPKSLAAYALESVLEVLCKENAETLDENILKLWIVSMVISGKKASTCKRYFGKIHSIYNEWNKESESDVFVRILPVFHDLQEAYSDEANNNLNLVKRLFGRNEQSEDWQTTCIFFYLLYNPAANLSDAVNLTFADAPRFCPQIDDIINSFDSSHGRKYVFALKQGHSRPNEISHKLTKQLQTLLSYVGMQFENGFSRTSITSIWIAAALRCGVAVQDIRACIGTVPAEYSLLSLVAKSDIDRADKEKILCTVADSINSCVARWFVMKIRQGVSVDDIKESIGGKLPGRLNSMTLYYPTRTEKHVEGRRRIVREIPYLPNILFFKTRTDRVKSLFANIGDLAWCFRNTNSPESEYAVIPNRQMANFQQCIGRFTPDIKMELVDALQPLEKGRKVKVIGGIMAGYEGEILDVAGEPGKRMLFLSIADTRKACWTVHIEDIFIQPVA